MLLSLCFFFFFQAEDGIRDYKVTGVQTCALPIYWARQSNDWIVLRYADVLLMYAEAVNEGGAPVAAMTAEQALNAVRTRAGIASVSGLSSAAFRDSVWLERRREFVFEGQRWFDLSRWGTLNSVITAKTTEL